MNTSAETELTVVLTTYNRGDIVGDALASLAEQHWDGQWDIVLVDNDSDDHTPEVLERWAAKMSVPTVVVCADEERNRSYARNVAVEITPSRSIAFVDDDDVVGSGWVAAIGSALREHEFVASRSEYDRLNASDLAATATFQRHRLGKHFGVDVVDSAGSGIRREHWDALDGNDKSMFLEDTDFALRMHQRGVAPHFCDGAEYSVRLRNNFIAAFRRGRNRGKGELQLYLAYREEFPLEPESALVAIGRWARLVVQAPQLLSSAQRLIWAENAGRRIGRIRACINERTWYP